MGRRYELSDVEWEALSRYLPSAVTGGRPRVDDRRVLNGIVWKIRAGAAWRDVPARYGSWQSIYTRFRRWALDGTFQAAAHRTELVVSGPTSPAVPVRLTSSVVVEVVRAARASLLVVSFAAYGVPEVVDELVPAADRGVRVDLVLESSADDGGTLRGSSGASAAFRKLDSQATFWRWAARTRFAAGTSRPAMHAKIVAADSATALVSSSNLTDRGLSDNLEVGVVLHEPEVVRRLVEHFSALMTGTGPLKRLR
ncbi:DISARM system phospholipase D-like protein DrmC [Micromonospora chalcea]|uniref:DISARM system phospholipase D-like protein DrmC n=1 Tax=Micromonospora chalcea TaxID=1874 RepID=UPI003D7463C2